MGTYSDAVSTSTNSTYGPQYLKEMAAAASKALGSSKYGLGIKGGWSYLHEPLDESAKETIRYLRDAIGVRSMSHWCDEPGRYSEASGATRWEYAQSQWDHGACSCMAIPSRQRDKCLS